MNNISTIGVIPQLATYAALLTGVPSYDIPEPQWNYAVEIPYVTTGVNMFSVLPALDTYDELINNIEHILVKFIHSIVEDTTYWDEDVAIFINEKFWDLI